MMSAYFPEFESINHATVCQWMFELEAKLRTVEDEEPLEKSISLLDLSLPEILPKAKPRYIILKIVKKTLLNIIIVILDLIATQNVLIHQKGYIQYRKLVMGAPLTVLVVIIWKKLILYKKCSLMFAHMR